MPLYFPIFRAAVSSVFVVVSHKLKNDNILMYFRSMRERGFTKMHLLRPLTTSQDQVLHPSYRILIIGIDCLILSKSDFWPSIHLSICPSVHLSICPSVHLPIFPSVHLSICPSFQSSIHPSASLSVHLSIHPSVCPSIRPSIHPSIRQSVSPSVHMYTDR
jgi:hypothetical protein